LCLFLGASSQLPKLYTYMYVYTGVYLSSFSTDDDKFELNQISVNPIETHSFQAIETRTSSTMQDWTPDNLPDLTGKSYFITGGNSGIGIEAAKILCKKGANVVISARKQSNAEEAMAEIEAEVPGAKVTWVPLDLTDPDSITSAAAKVMETTPELNALICNAGVMQTPERTTKEGFELQFATNHLGHFRLTSALYSHLVKSKGRVVVVSSIAHSLGKINLDDLMGRPKYDPMVAYSQSKLANMLFAFELDRRLVKANSPVICIPCHPGYSATNLQTAGVGMEGGSRFFKTIYKLSNKLIAQPAKLGAYPEVLAAADPDAKRATYYGPTKWADMKGPVGLSKVAPQAKDEEMARKLWEATENLVGPFATL
jgi:NAD(P)-dependent dehydrogenase (short-subunit alcohol dehydrogenase family)